jgi:5-methylcytosine-specific restriction enzyme subunit McrC
MNYLGRTQNSAGDVDREDFFQIHTYMAYYNGKQEHNLKLGGLLYPIEAEYKNNKYPSMLHDKTQFIVDGIGLRIPQKRVDMMNKTLLKLNLKKMNL